MVGGYDLRLTSLPSAEAVWQGAQAAGLSSRAEVVFTGLGEPTRRLAVLLELTRRLKVAGVKRVRLDTDGLSSLREGRDVVADLVAAGLDAVSISLDAADAASYARLCPSHFGEAAYDGCRAFIRAAVAAGLEVLGELRRGTGSLRGGLPPGGRAARGAFPLQALPIAWAGSRSRSLPASHAQGERGRAGETRPAKGGHGRPRAWMHYP